MDNKTLRIEMTLAGVAMVIEREMTAESWDKFAKLGMASDGYRAVATKAFKGVKERDSLGFDKAEPLLQKAFAEAGYRVVSTEAYVAPTAEAEMKSARKEYAAQIAKGATVVGLAHKLKVAADEESVVKAIHAILYPGKDALLAALTK